MTALYLCYQSIHEPLTRTQVVAYLEGLAAAGHRIVLLTFEPPPPQAESASARHATRYFDIAFPMHLERQRSVLGADPDSASVPTAADAA